MRVWPPGRPMDDDGGLIPAAAGTGNLPGTVHGILVDEAALRTSKKVSAVAETFFRAKK